MPSAIEDTKSVAIVGAGLGGLTLALALHEQGVQVEIYELRQPDYYIGGAMMLSPNGLNVLDRLGVYERIKSKGYSFDNFYFQENGTHEIVGKMPFGGPEFGYHGVRIYRSIVVKELRAVASEKGIKIHYGHGFDRIVADMPSGVVFALKDGTQVTADIVVGTDGIHSKVRKYLYPEMAAKYVGILTVTWSFDKKHLRLPASMKEGPLVGRINKGAEGLMLAPQNPEGTDVFAALPMKCEESVMESISEDKEKLLQMVHANLDAWSDLPKSALEQAGTPEGLRSMNPWAFHVMPPMRSWASESGRVIIMGDAAHAMPPTTAQGANQAMEDGLTLALIMSKFNAGASMTDSLKKWQEYRQERVKEILELSKQVSGHGLGGMSSTKDLPPIDWLFKPDIEGAVEGILRIS